MKDRVEGGEVILAWIAKCTLLVVPASIFPRVWTAHPHMAFGVGLGTGIVSQHFIPPKGKPVHLCILLILAAIGALVEAKL
jgi:hypothetical protein